MFYTLIDFSDFYKKYNLKSYPFDKYTSEKEVEFSSKLFVKQADYSLIKDTFDRGETLTLIGNRGTGKTAVLMELDRSILDRSKKLICYIDNFEEIKFKKSTTEINESEYYYLIAKKITIQLVENTIAKKKAIRKLSEDDKIFFSYLISEFLDEVTKERIVEKIENIQLSFLKKLANKFSKIIHLFANYGVEAATSSLNAIITAHYPKLPQINEKQMKNIFPYLEFQVEKNFNNIEKGFSFLKRVCKLVNKIGFDRIIVFLDKLDEDTRFESDAQEIANFIKPLLSSSNLQENKDIQLVTSVWKIPFNYIKHAVRTQKYKFYDLEWKDEELVHVFNKRIEVFTDGNPIKFEDFFEDVEITPEIKELSNKNPRDLWHIFNYMLREQFLNNWHENKLENKNIELAMEKYVKEFNYFEYYPRVKNARSNSMDIYKYSNHLIKLTSDEFTANQLNSEAGTGSSTQNYITSMQRIGLVKALDRKRAGGTLYKIIDPKIRYARKYKLKLEK